MSLRFANNLTLTTFSVRTAVLLAMLLVCGVSTVYAATKAGTVIKNQASASYIDVQGVERVATSNVVQTLIQQVAAVELSPDQDRLGAAGQEVFFSHLLVNTGNGIDSYVLDVQSISPNNFDLNNLQIYLDNNRDGLADSSTPITSTIDLGPDESTSIVIGGVIPASALSGDLARFEVSAVSVFDNSKVVINTDTVTVSDSAVIELTKNINGLQGLAPSGPYTVSLFYRNTGEVEATDVLLIDALPEGMTYVPDSGLWSGNVGTVLSDDDPNDVQGGIRYCAYDSSCATVPDAVLNADSDSTNQVTATISSLAPGQSGTLDFQVMIDASLSASVLYNQAEFAYTSNGALSNRELSNTVPFRVLVDAGVVINGSNSNSTDGTAEPQVLPLTTEGSSILFTNTVWNLGNSVDTFHLTNTASSFPEGTTFKFLQADGQTPLLDTSGNGVPDTGPIEPGGSYQITLQVILPTGVTGDNSGAAYQVTSVATSVNDQSISNPIINRLGDIVGGSVDITNTAPLGDTLATGVGTGPEPDPVTVLAINPGDTAVLDLYVNNTSDFAVEFDLSASIYDDFSSVELPEGWRVQYTIVDDTIVSSTGVIPAGEHVVVKAHVRVPADALPSSESIYFRAFSEQYSLVDIKHDAFVVNDQPSILLTVSQQGQAQAGGSYVYSHSLENAGNTDIANIALAVTDSRGADGWSSLIYEDTDGDGEHGTADQQISLASLAAGEAKTIFVKVFAPATAAEGVTNLSELSATWATGTLTLTDTTIISSGQITVIKEQALDNGCDGTLDSAYSLTPFSVEPGNNCVSYRLTAANLGSATILNVLVADATPTFTSYNGAATCSQPNCAIDEPAPGGQGEIKASLPSLQSGDSVVVEFMVKVD